MKPNEMANPNVNSTPIKSDISTTLPFTTTQRYRVESHLVLDVIGHSLTEYNSSYEMTTAVRDALVGKFLDLALN